MSEPAKKGTGKPSTRAKRTIASSGIRARVTALGKRK